MAGARYAANIGLIAGLVLTCTGAFASQDLAARSWAASCASCHGTDGRSAGVVPSLAGRSKSDLLAVLKEFKAGKRTATIMHQYALGYSDAELERIADYFSQQPR